MKKVILTFLNKELNKRNFFSIFRQLQFYYELRNKLNLFHMNDLRKDLHEARKFLAANVYKNNISYSLYYYKILLAMENEIKKLILIKINK